MSKLLPAPLLLVFALPIAATSQSRTAASSGAKPEAAPAWQAAIAARRQQLIASNGSGTDTALRDRLLQMRQDDQAARGLAAGANASETQQGRVAHLNATDAQLTAELKRIVADKGWPIIALVGIDASDAAMLLLSHSPDHAWQLQLLPQLEQLADAGKIDAAPLALVIDKQLVACGKPQRYGSQFKLVNGHMAMYAVEDPGGLDSLRARAMLPPMDAYKQQLGRIYGLKATNEIVSATPPAAQ